VAEVRDERTAAKSSEAQAMAETLIGCSGQACHDPAHPRRTLRGSPLQGGDRPTVRVDRSPSVPPEMIARIVAVLHPEQVWLFGSRARGEARADSDWDFMAILADDAPEQDLDLASVWQRLRDLRLRRVEVFTMTRSEFAEWNRSLGTLAEIVASTGVVVYGS
jgi:predicted nucleotidyltransferase